LLERDREEGGLTSLEVDFDSDKAELGVFLPDSCSGAETHVGSLEISLEHELVIPRLGDPVH
jgi:hypothetical protein